MARAFNRCGFITAISAFAALSSPALAAEFSRAPFGQLSTGEAVEAITLRNGKGVSATVITYGATLQSLVGPDRQGRPADIVLGFSDAAAYERNASYFGASVGRFANRIGNGRFSLDGKQYQLALNDHERAALHGSQGLRQEALESHRCKARSDGKRHPRIHKSGW